MGGSHLSISNNNKASTLYIRVHIKARECRREIEWARATNEQRPPLKHQRHFRRRGSGLCLIELITLLGGVFQSPRPSRPLLPHSPLSHSNRPTRPPTHRLFQKRQQKVHRIFPRNEHLLVSPASTSVSPIVATFLRPSSHLLPPRYFCPSLHNLSFSSRPYPPSSPSSPASSQTPSPETPGTPPPPPTRCSRRQAGTPTGTASTS